MPLIASVPTLLFMRGGQTLSSATGVLPADALRARLETLVLAPEGVKRTR